MGAPRKALHNHFELQRQKQQCPKTTLGLLNFLWVNKNTLYNGPLWPKTAQYCWNLRIPWCLALYVWLHWWYILTPDIRELAGREFWRDLAGGDNKVKKQKLVLFLPAWVHWTIFYKNWELESAKSTFMLHITSYY